MQNIFTPFLSYSLFSLFFFVQTILSPTPKIIQPNPISKPSHISTHITIHPNPPLHFPTEPNTRKKKSQSSSNSTPPPPQFWKRAENCKFFFSTVEWQPTRFNSASLDKPFFFFLVGLKLFLVALVYLTLACQLLSTPFSIVEKKKRKKRDVSTRERVRASVVVGWKYGSPLITSYVPRNFCSYTPRFNPCFPLRARCTTSRAHWSRELVWAPVQFVAFYLHTCKWYLR